MKTLINLFLSTIALPVLAQEAKDTTVTPPFWQDKTFLILIGSALILIIVLIVKKIMDKRGENEYETTNS